jgi:SAM-dependent methyltransferase
MSLDGVDFLATSEQPDINLHPSLVAAKVRSNQSFYAPVKDGWVVARRFQRSSGTPYHESTEGYIDILPTFHGRNALEWLKELSREQLKQARVLDIGAVAGIALLDIRNMLETNLDLVGIGKIHDTEKGLYDGNKGVHFQDGTKNTLSERSITFLEQSVLDFSSHPIAKGGFDVVMAVYSLNQVPYPHLDMARIVHGLLRPGGVAFLGPFEDPIFCHPKTNQNMGAFAHIRDANLLAMEINRGGVAFQRDYRPYPDVFKLETNISGSDIITLVKPDAFIPQHINQRFG